MRERTRFFNSFFQSLMTTTSDFSIGLDLGGTNLRAAAVTRDGTMLDSVSGKTAYSAGREAIVSDMVEAIVTLRERWGTVKLAGIGVAVPGFILLKEGVIRNSNNLASLEDFPIRDEMSRRLGTQVILENDANAAALGEKWIGAGREVDDLVLVTLGTGIGGGIVSNGNVLRGTYFAVHSAWPVSLVTSRWFRTAIHAAAGIADV
jgi:glucokinase